MFQITQAPLPASAMLNRYADQADHYTDCFATEVDGTHSIAAFIEAFFNSPVLRLERVILKVGGYGSTYADVIALADGSTETLAGWRLEERDEAQILLTVPNDSIRTWMMVEHHDQTTRLLFGSALVPRPDNDGTLKISATAKALTGFHKLYSRIVLGSAKWQLKRMKRAIK